MGLAGVLLVLQPQANGQTWSAVASLLCAISLAAGDLVTRRLPAEIPSVLVAWCATLAVPLAGTLWMFGQGWTPLGTGDLACLGAAAVCAALGNYALIGALRGAELSVVAPFRYTIILWALSAGCVGWGEVPNGAALLGIALVAAGGAIALRIARCAEGFGLSLSGCHGHRPPRLACHQVLPPPSVARQARAAIDPLHAAIPQRQG